MTPGEGLLCCFLRGGGDGGVSREGPGGASSEEEAPRWASRWGAIGGDPEGSLPGWRPGDSACMPAPGGLLARLRGARPRRAFPWFPSSGISEEGPWRRAPGWASLVFLRGGASGMTR